MIIRPYIPRPLPTPGEIRKKPECGASAPEKTTGGLRPPYENCEKPVCLPAAPAAQAGALHADRRANTVRPYIEMRRPAKKQRPAKRRRPTLRSVFSRFTFHLSRFTFHVSLSIRFYSSPFPLPKKAFLRVLRG
jgi:hypothetical protein